MKKVNLYIVFIVILQFQLILLFGQSPNRINEISNEIDEVVDLSSELELFSGTILVAQEGEILYSRAEGEANKDFDIKNSINTKFNIGSINKSFTATAIMLLVQKGLLDINDAVSVHLKDFPFGNEISIYHLLTHTAGFGNYLINPEYSEKRNEVRNIQDLINIIYQDTLVSTNPGEYMSYSNSGIIIAGAIIEEVSGKSYSDFLQENIFSPLKMINTYYAYPDEVISNRSVGYTRKMSGGFINNSLLIHNPSPAGGLLTTVGDLLLFDQALYTDDFLKEEYKKIMFKPYKRRYACGWGVFERFNNTVIGHSGGAPGINAWFRRYVNNQYTIIVLSNYDEGAESILYSIEAILYDKDYKLPRKPVGEFLYPMLLNENVEDLSSKLERLLSENDYQIRNPYTLNAFAYVLLRQKDMEMAIKFFMLNTILFKDDANAFDSLAEAYMTIGNNELAIKNYEISLKLDPDNRTAKNNLEILKIN